MKKHESFWQDSQTYWSETPPHMVKFVHIKERVLFIGSLPFMVQIILSEMVFTLNFPYVENIATQVNLLYIYCIYDPFIESPFHLVK